MKYLSVRFLVSGFRVLICMRKGSKPDSSFENEFLFSKLSCLNFSKLG